jgi:hypothetical protein
MPIKNLTLTCVNHPDHTLTRTDGLGALSMVSKNEDGSTTALPRNGMPVVFFYCELCGYVEMYAEHRTAIAMLETAGPPANP